MINHTKSTILWSEFHHKSIYELEIALYLGEFNIYRTFDSHVKAKFLKRKYNKNFGLVFLGQGGIKLNKIITSSLTWIFASNNGIKHIMYQIFVLDINIGNKLIIMSIKFRL